MSSRLVYFEIHATEPERLIDFYTHLFGWRFERCDQARDYWKIVSGPGQREGINGGLTARPGTSPLRMQAFNAFVCIMMVDTLELALEQVVALGGKIVEQQMPVPGVGSLSYAQDPDGNVFGLMQAGECVL
jgi:predicted enzyme related to lactoylglutathione lyase